MNAKEYYESKEWGNPDWDRATASQFDKSEMLDFAEHYASQKKLYALGFAHYCLELDIIVPTRAHVEKYYNQGGWEYYRKHILNAEK